VEHWQACRKQRVLREGRQFRRTDFAQDLMPDRLGTATRAELARLALMATSQTEAADNRRSSASSIKASALGSIRAGCSRARCCGHQLDPEHSEIDGHP
jgi:hypothetical protein